MKKLLNISKTVVLECEASGNGAKRRSFAKGRRTIFCFNPGKVTMSLMSQGVKTALQTLRTF